MTIGSTNLSESVSVECSASAAHRYLMDHFASRDDVEPTVLLRVPLADLALDREVVVRLSDLPSKPAEYVMKLSWSAKGGGPYPTFSGSLACLPDTATTSRIELKGTYTIPGGVVGKAFDVVVGHRIAAAAARALLQSLLSLVEEARDHERGHMLLAAPKPYPPTYE
jgi:hypothetical protein